MRINISSFHLYVIIAQCPRPNGKISISIAYESVFRLALPSIYVKNNVDENQKVSHDARSNNVSSSLDPYLQQT